MSSPKFSFALKMQEPLPLLEVFERIGVVLAPLQCSFIIFNPATGEIRVKSWEEINQRVRSTLLPDDDFIPLHILWPNLGVDVSIYVEPIKVEMNCPELALVEGEEAFFYQFTDLAKTMAVSFPTDFAVGAWEGFWGEDWIDEHLKNYDVWGQLETNFALTYIPTFAEEPKELESTYDKAGFSVLPSFIILSRERYEASKPYLPNMPVKFCPFRQEPIICVPKKPVIKGIEELSNGGVFLFIDYPLNFESVRRLKKEGYWKDIGL